MERNVYSPCNQEKNIASRKWQRHFREAKAFFGDGDYKYFVPSGRKLVTRRGSHEPQA